ncbi:hypothetical protein [Arthrobacter sp. efr-133-TYG-104]|uniref:hypothetical protein n=1 Tax=Arthrobacter sp. efr-133-TYG-104 TaxID=3040324 RepID=UPI00254B7FE5|nr:hypothetical protein [Arthrobacter sp. efr-133-TYG-104]
MTLAISIIALAVSIITVILVVITTVVAVMTYRRGAKQRQLLYRVVTTKTKLAEPGKRPHVCYEVTMALMNIGQHDILAEDFDGAQPLEIDLGTAVLGIGPLRGEKLNKVRVSVGDTCVSIEPALIPSRAFILRQVLTRSRPDPRLSRRSLADIPVLSPSEAADVTFRRFGRATVPSIIIVAGASGGYDGFMSNELTADLVQGAQIWLRSFELVALLLAVVMLTRCALIYAKGTGTFRYKIWSELRQSKRIRKRLMVGVQSRTR